VRDAGYFGTPVVLVGERQEGREADAHVTRVQPARDTIAAAIASQLAHGPYAASTLYGDGLVSERIAEQLVRLAPYPQKRLHYIYESAEGVPVNGHASVGNRDRARGIKRNSAKKYHVALG
jgi:UDP-N-acetylglucosamine 2-epimerase